MATRETLPPVRRGIPIKADLWNRDREQINKLLNFRLPRDVEGQGMPASDSSPDDPQPEPETITEKIDCSPEFVSAETETVRIEDPDDSSTYVDVEVVTSVTLKWPIDFADRLGINRLFTLPFE